MTFRDKQESLSKISNVNRATVVTLIQTAKNEREGSNLYLSIITTLGRIGKHGDVSIPFVQSIIKSGAASEKIVGIQAIGGFGADGRVALALLADEIDNVSAQVRTQTLVSIGRISDSLIDKTASFDLKQIDKILNTIDRIKEKIESDNSLRAYPVNAHTHNM